jgi:hypothetical protein
MTQTPTQDEFVARCSGLLLRLNEVIENRDESLHLDKQDCETLMFLIVGLSIGDEP